jgi:hypothetical protein
MPKPHPEPHVQHSNDSETASMDERDCCTLLLYKGQKPGTAIGTGPLTWSGRQDSNLRPLDPQARTMGLTGSD